MGNMAVTRFLFLVILLPFKNISSASDLHGRKLFKVRFNLCKESLVLLAERFQLRLTRGGVDAELGVAPEAAVVNIYGDAVIGGVGAVLGFVPQMLILFFLLALLEDCGYMSRVAFIMDKLFRKFGLSGKSFIFYPLIHILSLIFPENRVYASHCSLIHLMLFESFSEKLL